MNETDAQSPLNVVLGLMSGHAITRSLTVVTELGIADLLADGPKSAAQLAASRHVDEQSLYRLLRALAAIGVFSENAAHQFSLTALSDRLRAAHPRSLRDFVRIRGHEMYWQAWGALDEAVRSGAAAFECAHGVSHFKYFDAHPEAGHLFNDGMRSLSGQIYDALVEVYDFSPFDTIIDVGGGQGMLLAGVLRAHPKLRGILFDLPPAIEASAEVLQAAGVANRCTAIAGDFFGAIPTGADLAILSRIVHNWGDAQALSILRNCRGALAPGGKLLIVEYVVTDDPAGVDAKLFDLQMLVYFGRARERSEEEYRTLLRQAGFELNRIVRMPTSIAALEATAV
jgi:SAM-dependent methyltransferase